MMTTGSEDDSFAPQVSAVGYLFLFLSTIATCFRVYCRVFVVRAFALDDWLAVLAQVIYVVFSVMEQIGVRWGTGRHMADIPVSDVPLAMRAWWTCEPLFVLCHMAIKASIAVFLLRLCVTRTHRMIIYVTLAITEIYSVFFFVMFLVQCRPISYFWLRYLPTPPDGYCMSPDLTANSYYAYSAISCVVDWTFSILPIFLVWNLQMTREMKLLVAGILATSAIASAATIIRLPYIHTLLDVDDFLYSTSQVAIWSTVETGLGITAASAATLRPLLRTWLGWGSTGTTTTTTGFQRQPSAMGVPSSLFRSWNRRGDEESCELHDKPHEGLGVTTIIDFERRSRRKRGDSNRTEDHHHYYGSDSADIFSSSPTPTGEVGGGDDSGSQVNIVVARPPGVYRHHHHQSDWSIRVQRSLVQTGARCED